MEPQPRPTCHTRENGYRDQEHVRAVRAALAVRPIVAQGPKGWGGGPPPPPPPPPPPSPESAALSFIFPLTPQFSSGFGRRRGTGGPGGGGGGGGGA